MKILQNGSSDLYYISLSVSPISSYLLLPFFPPSLSPSFHVTVSLFPSLSHNVFWLCFSSLPLPLSLAHSLSQYEWWRVSAADMSICTQAVELYWGEGLILPTPVTYF